VKSIQTKVLFKFYLSAACIY